jgi:hypothetical protein
MHRAVSPLLLAGTSWLGRPAHDARAENFPKRGGFSGPPGLSSCQTFNSGCFAGRLYPAWFGLVARVGCFEVLLRLVAHSLGSLPEGPFPRES